MKAGNKLAAVILIIILMIPLAGTVFAEDIWICEICGTENNGNFCGSCGMERKHTDFESAAAPTEENRRESIIGFERSKKWYCLSCGAVVDTDFCTECGSRRDRSLAGSFVLFGAYEQDGEESAAEADPIDWIVLEYRGDKALLISRYGLDCVRFNENESTGAWKDCTLREWLNGKFLDVAFTADEQKHICSTRVSTDGEDTFDRVFLLSTDEAGKYFGSDAARKCTPSIQAIANGVYVDPVTQCSWWWLRSPGDLDDFAAFVDVAGCIDCCGDNVIGADRMVRPALWIKLPDAD